MGSGKWARSFFLSGVDLFFVLSGVLVGGIIFDNYEKVNFLKVFFIRRVCRIFPVYFLLIFTLICVLNLSSRAPFFDDWLLEKPLPIISYLTFTQSYVMGWVNYSGPKWAAVTWSVSVEEQFYFLMPFLTILLGFRKIAYIIVAGLLCAPLIRQMFFDNIGFYAGYMFFPGRMDSILWGCFVAYALRQPMLRSALMKALPLLVFGAFGIYVCIWLQNTGILTPNYNFQFTLLAIFYAILIFCILEANSKILSAVLTSRFLVFTGAISYSMYMFHQVINGLVHGFWFDNKPEINGMETIMASTLAVLITYGFCYLSLKFFEEPIRSWGAQYRYVREKPKN